MIDTTRKTPTIAAPGAVDGAAFAGRLDAVADVIDLRAQLRRVTVRITVVGSEVSARYSPVRTHWFQTSGGVLDQNLGDVSA